MSAVTQAGSGPTRDELERSLADRLGISPNATPEEIAPSVVYLASPASSFMTGSIVVADGGISAHTGFFGHPL